MIVRYLCIAVALLGAGVSQGFAAELISPRSQWRYLKGTAPASNPSTAWRAVNFVDSGWDTGPTPFYYGEPYTGTALDDMRGVYTSVFLRKTFTISDPAAVEQLELRTLSDDGFIAWINGVEVARYNMAEGEPAHDETSLGPLQEPIPSEITLLSNAKEYLVPGVNVLAVHAFNTSLSGSSDFVFDASLSSLVDVSPPVILSSIPAPGALVRSLNTIEVIFSEPVTGVDAADLLINGAAAEEVTSPAPGQYLFRFDEPAIGTVQITWAANHGITDLAPAANPLITGNWSYNFDPNAPAPQVMISEFMADNDQTLNDEDGDASDWIEIFNPTESSVDLTGWFLSNDTNNLALWKFPPASIPANSYLVVFASSKNRTAPGGELHTSFNLRKEGAFLALSDPRTNIISAFSPAYPGQDEDISYGRERANPQLLGFFPNPTPGEPNTPGGAGFAPEVRFSVRGKTFQAPFDLELSCANTNAVIRYVTGKTELPTETSPIYTGPIRISNTMQIRARAFVNGLLPSDPQSESYILLSGPVVNFTSDLPVVILHNYGGGAVPSSGEQFVMMQIYEPRNGVTSLTNAPDTSERARFRLRGSSTQGYPKGSFALETWNEFGDDKDVEILGMPEESDWVFYAPNNFEPALIHNPYMHQLSRDVGRYSSRTRFVEVFLNTGGGALHQGNYNGIYVIEEKIKRGRDRVDVDNLEPEHLQAPEITGGYLLKIDRADPGDSSFSAAGQGALNYVDPKGEEIRTAARDPQEDYIRDFLNDFGSALNGPNFRNPETGYAAYLDVDAAIDHHVLNVYAHNVDALRLSTYLHKPRNGKLTFGPLWDFDRALGSTDGRDANPRVWNGGGGTEFFTYTWWNRLFQDIDFWQKWIDRWEELRLTHLSHTNIYRLIDELSGQVANAQPRERQRWGISPRGGSYATEITRMKNYQRDRTTWIDSQLVRPPVLSRQSGPISAGTTVSLTAANTLYYTLDGTDPRLPGGAISPNALTYSGPITINNNARLIARAHRPGHSLGPTFTARSPWSGKMTATYIVETPKLEISEIMYNPAPHSSNTYTNEDYEFIEVHNTGTTTLQLAGFAFTNGIDFRFTSGSLAPGGHIVVVKNRTVFESRYGTTIPIAGEYTGSLNNDGEQIALVGPMLEPVADFAYLNTAVPITDGAGFSLVPLAGTNEWRASSEIHGSPGAADSAPASVPAVIISEVLARPATGQSDFIEVANLTATAADITGWYLSDDLDEPKKFRIPATVLQPGQHKTFTDAQFNSGANSFGLGAGGDEVYLFSADAAGELTGHLHGFAFGRTAAGSTLIQARTSDGREFFRPSNSPTPDAANSGVRVGPLVITELMFQPAPVNNFDNSRDEYIELRNNSAQTVPLFDPANPLNPWRFFGGVEFNFPENVSLAPGGILLVVNFDPGMEPWAETDFRARFSVPANVPIFGPLNGKLSNNGERIILEMPEPPDPQEPGTIPYLIVDEFAYNPLALTHPAFEAAGTGKSIHRADTTWGEEPASWSADAPTPGIYPVTNPDADGDGLPASWEIAHGLNDNSATGANGASGDPDGDGMTNLQEYQAGTHPNDSESALRFAAVEKGNNAMLSLNAAADRTYSILFTTDLASGSWTKLTDVPAGAGRVVEITDTAATDSTRFYRIVSPAQ